MKDLEFCERQYIHVSRAWYGKSALCDREQGVVDEVIFGLYNPDGGTPGEMNMRWHKLGKKPVPRLEVFDDAWVVLWQFNDVLRKLTELDNKNITPEEFCAVLNDCGFKDRTPLNPE